MAEFRSLNGYTLEDYVARYQLGDGVKNKNIICVGDSFLEGSGAGNTRANGWAGKLLNYNPSSIKYAGASGGGFVHTGGANATFYQALYSLTGKLSSTEKQETQIIIVVGGYNDYTHAYQDTIIPAVQTFINYAKNNYPNAKLYYFANAGRLGMYRATSYMGFAGKVYGDIYNTFIKNGCNASLDLIWHTYKQTALCSDSDNVHLNESGYILYAGLINAFIAGSDIAFFESGGPDNSPVYINSEIGVRGARHYYVCKGDEVYLHTTISVTSTSELGQYDNIIILPNYLSPMSANYDTCLKNITPIACRVQTGNDYYSAGGIQLLESYTNGDTIRISLMWHRGEG